LPRGDADSGVLAFDRGADGGQRFLAEFEMGVEHGQLCIGWQRCPLADAGVDNTGVADFAEQFECGNVTSDDPRPVRAW